jgi:hypothetical protein
MPSPPAVQQQDPSFLASPSLESAPLDSFSIDSWVDERLKDLEESDIIITSLPARCRPDITETDDEASLIFTGYHDSDSVVMPLTQPCSMSLTV